MNAVVILGAGATAGFGVPTLRSLFKDQHAREYLAQNARLLSWLRDLIWTPRGLDLESSHLGPSVEDILTLMRDSERQDYGLPQILTGADLASLPQGLYVLIKRAIYDGKSSRRAVLNPLLHTMRQHAQHTTWASFNWDCLFEASFWYSSGPYAGRVNPELAIEVMGWGDVSQAGRHTFLKLHGGINWWYINGQISYLPFGVNPELNARWWAYERGTAEGEPVILEPSHYKYAGPIYTLLKPQWQSFAAALLMA